MTIFSVSLILIIALTESFAAVLPNHHSQTLPSGFSATLPITRRARSGLRKRQGSQSGAIGLGDAQDSAYSVQVVVGETAVPVIFDTGSSDLWSITSDCTASSCGSTSTSTPQISKSSLKSLGMNVELNYGDSAHPTFASGEIGSGAVSVAGLQLNDQSLAAVDATNTSLSDEGLSGIFGLGFPNPLSGSVIFRNLLKQGLDLSTPSTGSRPIDAAVTDAFISALPSQGPFLSRLVANGQLKQPMFTVTLEREDIEVGGNVGQLTIGQLPDGVRNESLTWVPVRLYTLTQGGISGSTSNPNEVYPTRWEIPIDDVVLNGQTLPKPAIQAVGYTALIDSGTSFLAGPQDVVSSIYRSIAISGSPESTNAPLISCNKPVDLTYVIGGKNFPVDPRDFLSQQTDTDDCNAGSLLPTDAPSEGALMSWILGNPFMKSNLVAFYYGNLTHPSVDPPRMGFLSTVPSNAADLLAADVKSADEAGGFIVGSVSAPTASFVPASTNSLGVGQAPTGTAVGSSRKKNGTSSIRVPLAVIVVVTLLCGFLT